MAILLTTMGRILLLVVTVAVLLLALHLVQPPSF